MEEFSAQVVDMDLVASCGQIGEIQLV
jgi:hypothetical protein